MIRYNTSNDRVCKLVIKWCRVNGYRYAFSSNSNSECVYPFEIDAPSCSETELGNMIKEEIDHEHT
ncbi:MAG: hypothetical protein IKS51_07470 [Erysipelotrichaceae bacterium]|nr:hypothetical protein [Erysipelotrichaceae bacterium]